VKIKDHSKKAACKTQQLHIVTYGEGEFRPALKTVKKISGILQTFCSKTSVTQGELNFWNVPQESKDAHLNCLVPLIVAQLVKKFPAFYGIQVHYHVHKSLPLVPVLD
jgi:hypothetical protein